MARTYTIEIPDIIKITNSQDFDFWAGLFGVQVGKAGRKPMAKLAKAIRDYDSDALPTAIEDTEYFQAAMADGTGETSEYSARLAELRSVRDTAIDDARKAFEAGKLALQAELGIASASNAPAGDVVRVSAFTPMLDKATSEIQRTKQHGDKPGKVKFLPSRRTVDVTKEHIKQARELLGRRGRPSQSDTLAAAVIAGNWFPTEHLTVDGWHTVLLKDATVGSVES